MDVEPLDETEALNDTDREATENLDESSEEEKMEAAGLEESEEGAHEEQ